MIQSVQPIGYYGKFPARGDFIGRRLPADTVTAWDDWLQEAIAASQDALGAGWRERYYVSPIWRFVLPPGMCGNAPLAGVAMPSVDKVGRCFPLMLGLTWSGGTDAAALAEGNSAWFDALENLALAGLADDFDPSRLDVEFDPPLDVPSATPSAPLRMFAGRVGDWFALADLSGIGAACRAICGAAMPDDCSLWWTAGSEHVGPGGLVANGLPAPSAFTAFIDGDWAGHGWKIGGGGVNSIDSILGDTSPSPIGRPEVTRGEPVNAIDSILGDPIVGETALPSAAAAEPVHTINSILSDPSPSLVETAEPEVAEMSWDRDE